jgi:hypothetical protein
MTLPPSERLVRNWRYRSAEMRAISETMTHEETRATMERLADSYDEMADSLDRRLRGPRAPTGSEGRVPTMVFAASARCPPAVQRRAELSRPLLVPIAAHGNCHEGTEGHLRF